jgi:hypothetical protein
LVLVDMSTEMNTGGLDDGGSGAVDEVAAFAAVAAAALTASLDDRKRSVAPRLSLAQELWASTEYIFQSQLTWLLILGPIAIVGDSLGILGEATRFAFAGIALIPCAERYVSQTSL